MKPCLLHHDVAHGLSECLFESVPPDSAFERRIGFATAVFDKSLVAVLGGAHFRSRFKPSTSSVACIARRGWKFKGRVLTAERDCVRMGYRPHMGAFLSGLSQERQTVIAHGRPIGLLERSEDAPAGGARLRGMWV